MIKSSVCLNNILRQPLFVSDHQDSKVNEGFPRFSSILESICLNILTFYAQWRSDFDLVFNMIDLSSEYNHKIDKVKTEICIYNECDICVQMFNYNNQFK